MALEGISAALKEGCWLHAFCLRSGMVVVHVSKTPGGELKGFGEHVHIDGALVHADEDFLTGHRGSTEVHGKMRPCVLTVGHDASSALDAWIKCDHGYAFDAYWGNGKYVAELHGFDARLDHFVQAGRGATFVDAWKCAYSAARITFRRHRR